ncbi:MAG: CHAD domain-containing protein [Spirochaetia bacterium]
MVEQEYKFLLSEHREIDHIGYLVPGWKEAREKEVKYIQDIYYDTKEQYLNSIGFGLRQRVIGETAAVEAKWEPLLQTGFFSRTEWELWSGPKAEIPGYLELKAVFEKETGIRINSNFGEALQISGNRHKHVLTNGRTSCEFSVDYISCTVLPGEEKREFTEIELELLEGEENDFQELGEFIKYSLGLKPSLINKKRTALRLFQKDATELPLPKVLPESDAKDTVRSLLKHLFESALIHLPGAKIGHDIEYIHQFRINLRKARTLLRDAKKHMPIEKYLTLQNELRWLHHSAGDLREADVFLRDYQELLPPETPNELSLIFNKIVKRMKDEAQDVFRRITSSPRFLDSIKLVRRELSSKDLFIKEAKSMSFSKYIAAILTKKEKDMNKRVKSTLKNWKHGGKDSIHQLRISFKKLRYAAELFPEEYDQLNQNAKKMQKALGAYMDTIFMADLMESLSNHITEDDDSPELLSLARKIEKDLRKTRKVKRKEVKKALKQW